MGNTLPDRVRLREFEIELRVGEVRSAAGNGSRLQEKSLRVLILLIEHPGELVTREEIQRRLWPNDTVVDFENGINTAVRRLRLALNDSADKPQYIENIPRRGYRLLVPVEPLSARNNGAPLPAGSNLLGKKVSHYRVLEVIEGGGMGMVYKAEDLNLPRQVALKFLPEELAGEKAALQRFRREAEAASTLDHPSICTIHEVEEYEGQPFIVMQLLHGETLRDRLAKLASEHKLLPLNELLQIAIQICDGLQAAHANGIIHRDIKPANIFLTSGGQAKILDFGLAKLVRSAKETESSRLDIKSDGAATAPQPLRSSHADLDLSDPGNAMGTAGYMSPEQLRREKLDARSDIFSFGLVLYEMATGQRAFTGDTQAAIQDAIQNQTPVPPRELNSEIPSELDAVIDKALQKDREHRYQSSAEMASALAGLRDSDKPQRSVVSSTRARLFLTAALLLILTVAVSVWWWHRRGTTTSLEPKERQLTANPVEDPVIGAAISPDGKYVAYHDQTGVFLRSLESGETHSVALPAELPKRMFWMCWSPTGEKLVVEVARLKGGWDIWAIPSHKSEDSRLLYQKGAEVAVSHDGQRIAFVGYGLGSAEREIWVGTTDGKTPYSLLTVGDRETVAAPTWSPDDRWIAYGRRWQTKKDNWNSDIEVRPAEGGPARVLVSDSNLPNSVRLPLAAGGTFTQTWLFDGRLVFSVEQSSETLPGSRTSLWLMSTNPKTGSGAGNPHRLTQWYEGLHAFNLTASMGSRTLALVKTQAWGDIYVAGGISVAPHRLTLDTRGSVLDAWTGDGQAIIFDGNRDGKQEIFQQSLNESIAQKIISGKGDVFGLDKTPDGIWFLYAETKVPGHGDRGPSDSMWLMRRAIRGGPPERVLEMAATDSFLCSSNSQAIPPCLLSHMEDNNLVFYPLDPVKGKGLQVGIIKVIGRFFGWAISPDGSRVALVDEDKFGKRIELLTLATGSWHEIPVEASPGSFQNISWTSDGKAFLAICMDYDEHDVLQVTMDGKVSILWHSTRTISNALPSPKGKYVAFNAETWDSNVWLIQDF